jgi:outer membrane receptor protein involved in Fe transport
MSSITVSTGGRGRDRTRGWVLTSASATALLTALAMASPTHAQTAPAAGEAVDEIVVTGSRIVRDGFQAPTPVSVMSAEEIALISPTHVMDMVRQLPALAGSTTPQTGHTGVSAGTAGISTINLRNMGDNRTLVLLDGRRIVPAVLGGSPDINQMPDSLISRVDVVTGGASAAYGSDAVSGVVNFILDKEYTGIKGDVTGSITHYGDGARVKSSLTYGTPFAGGKGHLLLATDWARNAMVKGRIDEYPPTRDLQDQTHVRPIYSQSLFAHVINNPAWTATGPQRIGVRSRRCDAPVQLRRRVGQSDDRRRTQHDGRLPVHRRLPLTLYGLRACQLRHLG